MIPLPEEDVKKEAFRLFEDGRYGESLECCHRILATKKEPSLEVLAATNLYYTGKFEDAEVFFRDLAHRMPESSYVHSYLAKVLEARGDEGAVAEWGNAVHLDPTNPDALRSYAASLISRKDFRAALPIMRRLVQQGEQPGDVRTLMMVLIQTGEAREALALAPMLGPDGIKSPEYLDALFMTGDYRAAANAAADAWRDQHDPAVLRRYLSALSRYDIPAALDAYSPLPVDENDPATTFDYVLLLREQHDYHRALTVLKQLLARAPLPQYRLARCEVYAALGDEMSALAAYESLVADELKTKDNLTVLGQVISTYRAFLRGRFPEKEALARFQSRVSADPNVVSLRETARFCEDTGDISGARSWYYRAYRADYLAGGIPYARFLATHGEERECEKVMLYILSNVKKSADLGSVAAAILDKDGGMRRMKRLIAQLVRKFAEHRPTLGSEEMELSAVAFLVAAEHALREGDYSGCKYYCLVGIDAIPAHALTVRLEDYLRLVRACKEQSIADRQVLHARAVKKPKSRAEPVQQITDRLALTEQEQKILGFLRSHRKASEMDLRKLLGTRRVAGIMNRLVVKAAVQGMTLIEKKGLSEDGEVYEYSGT
jgi:tetratricopeptide (TPR) repeat protein